MNYDITKPAAPNMPTLEVGKKHPNPPLKGHKTPSAPLRPAPFTLLSAHLHAPETHPSSLIPEPLLCQSDNSSWQSMPAAKTQIFLNQQYYYLTGTVGQWDS